jgi:hypothetical protein
MAHFPAAHFPMAAYRSARPKGACAGELAPTRIALVGMGVGGTLTLSHLAEQADRSWGGTEIDIVDRSESFHPMHARAVRPRVDGIAVLGDAADVPTADIAVLAPGEWYATRPKTSREVWDVAERASADTEGHAA